MDPAEEIYKKLCRSYGKEEIPEPECFEILLVHTDGYEPCLWDMNGVPVSLAEITGADHEALDDEIDAWGNKLPLKYTGTAYEYFWDSPEQKQRYHEEGIALTRRAYEFLQRKHTFLYPDTDGKITMFEKTASAPYDSMST